MNHYHQKISMTVNDIIHHAHLMIEQAKKLEQASDPNRQDQEHMHAAMQNVMNCSNRIGMKIGELSLFL